ncbi:MAG: hypothetical protein J4203_02755 [Candidatus Diapherotrites archaeon]|uniref:Lipoprotein n=1 Tax=Candidatus Iainarchaeum sp. TaxID=3101447 RepID=A0A8T4L7V8_9ARCH|nr:hypothetical protein [Candidatus Diapherotrites archaeon]
MRPALPLIVLLSLLLFLSGCSLPKPDFLKGILAPSQPEDYCANFVSKDDCYLQVAQENQAPEFCKKIVDPPKSEQCLLGLALSSKNRALCNVYSSEPGKCLRQLALATNAVGVCAEIEDQNVSDDCYLAMAAKLSNPTTCLLARSPALKADCLYILAQQTNSPQACTNIFVDATRYKCLFDLSLKLANPEVCKALEATYSVDDCWKGLALAKKDSLACDRISEETMRDACHYEVGAVSGETIALKNDLALLCAKLPEKSQAAACQSRLSAYQISADFCSDIDSQPERVECLDKLNAFFVDASLCPEYRTRDAMDACFEFVALQKSSLETCKLVVDIPKELSCIYKLAVKEKNPKHCAETHVTDSFDYRNECYKEVAFLSKQPRNCDFIYFREKRAACRAEFAVLDQNYAICKEIPNEALSDSNDPFFTRDYCFKSVVETIRDKSLCDFIQDAKRKEACQAGQ